MGEDGLCISLLILCNCASFILKPNIFCPLTWNKCVYIDKQSPLTLVFLDFPTSTHTLDILIFASICSFLLFSIPSTMYFVYDCSCICSHFLFDTLLISELNPGIFRHDAIVWNIRSPHLFLGCPVLGFRVLCSNHSLEFESPVWPFQHSSSPQFWWHFSFVPLCLQ